MNWFRQCMLASAITSAIGCAPASPKVTQIIDGDTVKVTFPNGNVQHVDLVYIDAPEREQPMGREARAYLREKLLEQPVTFDAEKRLLLNGQPVAKALLENGLAWQSPDEAPFDIDLDYRSTQQQAMNNARGLWSLPHSLRVPPWQWRQDAKRPSNEMMRQQRAIKGETQ